MSVHDFTVTTAAGDEQPMAEFAGSPLLVVNTASKCGLAPQFEGLEKLQNDFGARGLQVIGFPCNQFAGQEPLTNEDVQETCRLNFGVNFPLMAKIDVNGKNADPLWKYMKQQQGGLLGGSIKWNFTKFLIDADGRVVKRYAPTDTPETIAPDIEALLTK